MSRREKPWLLGMDLKEGGRKRQGQRAIERVRKWQGPGWGT